MKELEADEFRRLGHLAVELAAEHMFGMRDRAVFTPMTSAERLAIMRVELPDAGLPPQRVLDFMRDRIMPHPMGNGHPRFFGWANPPPSALGVISDLIAAAMNPSCVGGDHSATYVEHCAVRWLMEMIGFPVAESQGILVSGGSAASLTCLAAARQHALQKAGWRVRSAGVTGAPQLVIYVSDQAHSSLFKAAELIGIGSDYVHIIPTDVHYRMDVAALREAIASDRAAGYCVMCVCACAGTMNTGAIDPLRAIADLCASEGLWLHVDAAIGGLAALDSTLPELEALSRAESVALDPHKWLGVPAECGAALVRDAQLLRDTFSYVPMHLRTEPGGGFGGLPWYSEYGFQQTRGFRALKLWATLLHLGRDGVRSRIEQHRALARALAERIIAQPLLLELLTEPELSVVCFRYIGIPEPTEERMRAFNRALVAQLQTEGDVFLTGTELKNGYALRVSIMHHSTRANDLAVMVQTVLNTAARLNEAGLRTR
jgi:glutamate/tyrosine decarboxylase-like PLP-dependent enzyme